VDIVVRRVSVPIDSSAFLRYVLRSRASLVRGCALLKYVGDTAEPDAVDAVPDCAYSAMTSQTGSGLDDGRRRRRSSGGLRSGPVAVAVLGVVLVHVLTAAAAAEYNVDGPQQVINYDDDWQGKVRFFHSKLISH